jgi:hypothetical protein
MAKKARKKSAAKGRKKSSSAGKKKTKAMAKKKKTTRKAKPKTIGGRLANAYQTVMDTMKGTDRLRNKLEQPGTSESE